MPTRICSLDQRPVMLKFEVRGRNMEIVAGTDTRAHDDVIRMPDHCQLRCFISLLHLIHLLSFFVYKQTLRRASSSCPFMCPLCAFAATFPEPSRCAFDLDYSPGQTRCAPSAKVRFPDPHSHVSQPVTLWIL